MKKLLLLATVLLSFSDGVLLAEAAPRAVTVAAKSPNQMNKMRRRLRRQAAQRMRRNKRMRHD